MRRRKNIPTGPEMHVIMGANFMQHQIQKGGSYMDAHRAAEFYCYKAIEQKLVPYSYMEMLRLVVQYADIKYGIKPTYPLPELLEEPKKKSFLGRMFGR